MQGQGVQRLLRWPGACVLLRAQLGQGLPEKGDFSINVTSLVFCRQIGNDCDRIHGERLTGFLSPGKELCIFIHCTFLRAE